MPRSYQIIDADAHVNPPATFWPDYLPAHLKNLAPRLEEAEDAGHVVFEGRRKKISLIGAQAGRTGKDFKMEGRLSDSRKGGWMPAERLADMDQDGMDAAVLFGGGPLGTGNDELFMASFGAYNRWLAYFLQLCARSSIRCRLRADARRGRDDRDDEGGGGAGFHRDQHPRFSAFARGDRAIVRGRAQGCEREISGGIAKRLFRIGDSYARNASVAA